MGLRARGIGCTCRERASGKHHALPMIWRRTAFCGQSEPSAVGAYYSNVPREPFHQFLFQQQYVGLLGSRLGRPPKNR